VLIFFGQGDQFFTIWCRRPLWTALEQKTAKLSIGYRPTITYSGYTMIITDYDF